MMAKTLMVRTPTEILTSIVTEEMEMKTVQWPYFVVPWQ